MATIATHRPPPAAPGVRHFVDPLLDAARLPIPAPDRPDALAGLSVVVACRDDAATAARAINSAARAAARTSLDYEILLVDDSSSDATADVLAGFARQGGRGRALLHADRRGSGASLRTGLSASSMPWVLLIDATDELDLEVLEDFLPLAPGHDLLLGWRVMRRGPATTRLNSAVWNALVSRVLGVSVRDVDCPLKLVRRDLLDRLELRAPGAAFGAELVAGARALGARVTEVPVRQRAELTAPGKSGASPHLGPRTLLALARLRRSGPKRRTDRLSRRTLGLAVAGVAVVAGVGWLYQLRATGLLGAGPRLAGALPLQQLAGDDAQPLLRMAAAWLPAGALAGLALGRLGHVRRPLLVTAVLGVVLLVVTGAASDAIASSLTFSSRLVAQLGHPAVWVATALLAIGAGLALRLPRWRAL
jgi:hypothetical protein